MIENRGYRFTVNVGEPPDAATTKTGTKLSRGANFRCLMSGTPIAPVYIYGEATGGRMGEQLMAIVVEGDRRRVYLSPTRKQEAMARKAEPAWNPEVAMPENPRWFSPPLYGLTTFGDLFTPRQLVALTTFSDLVTEARARVKRDAIVAGLPDDSTPLRDGGTGAKAYAEAVAVYLAFAVDKVADYWSSICTWHVSGEKMRNTFGRQAIPMTWDYAETNPLSSCTGNWMAMVDWVWKCINISPATGLGVCTQADASLQTRSTAKVVSTDPPYYDNIGYADLSDFFYVWLLRSLRPVLPDLFATLAVPKAEELSRPRTGMGTRKKQKHFSGRNDGRYAPACRAGASRLPGHDLLRLQAVREKRGRGHFQHRMGDLPGCRDRGRLLSHWHLASAHRTRQSNDRYGHQRPRLQYRPGLSPTPCGRADGHPPRTRCDPQV